MTTSMSDRVVNVLCRLGSALSRAVGNRPDDIQARREAGILDPWQKEEAELGIEPVKKEPPAPRRHFHHS